MTLLACGTCGVSMLSTALPPFTYWVQLLPLAFIAYHYMEWREGEFSLGKLAGRVGLATIAFILSAVMLAGIILPIIFLYILIAFGIKLTSSDKKAKMTAAGVLTLYALTGAVTFYQAKTQGPYWQLTRLQAGGPGQSYFSRTAKEQVFSKEELLGYLQSDNTTVQRNAAQVIEQLARFESDPEEAAKFHQSLQSIDPQLAKKYERALDIPSPEPDQSAPSPSPTP